MVFQSTDNTVANATAVALVQTWIPSSNTLSVTNIAGEFLDDHVIIGETSNARYSLVTFDPLESPAIKEVYDNQYIANNAGNIVDMTEINPFGPI